MRYEDFRWAGKLASEMGVVVTEQVEYTRPEERVEQITVPGRSGTLRRYARCGRTRTGKRWRPGSRAAARWYSGPCRTMALRRG